MKNILKILCCVLAAVLVLGIFWLATGFFGNPVSSILANRALKAYVGETYSHLDLETERYGYNFKTGGYFAYVASKTSRDTAFYINMDMLGHVTYDSYDTWVAEKRNTEQRVQEQYREMTDRVLDSAAFPYVSDIKGGELEFQQDWEWGDYRDHSYALHREELVMDKEYSAEEILDMGKRAGILTIYVQEDTVTPERAAEIMLHIRALFDEAGVPFYCMDFVLQYPVPEDDAPLREEDVRAELLYGEICGEGLVQRICKSHEVIYDRFAQMDREK